MARRIVGCVVLIGIVVLGLGDRAGFAAQRGGERHPARKWAFLVGIDRYADERIDPLRGAVNDVRELAAMLVNRAGFPREQVILLTTEGDSGKKPTRTNILAGLSELARAVPADSLVVVAFAGHGMESGGHAYLLPSDAAFSDDPRLARETALEVETARNIVLASQARNVVFFFDTCRNDPAEAAVPVRLGPDGGDRGVRGSDRSGRTVATVFAASRGERAYEIAADNVFGGYFMRAVAEGLGGAAASGGSVTLRGLASYLTSVVPRRVQRDLGEPYSQTPSVKIEGESDFTLVEAPPTFGGGAAADVSGITYLDTEPFRRPDPVPSKAELISGRTLLVTSADVASGRYTLVSEGRQIQSGAFTNGEFRLSLRPGRFLITVSAPNHKEYVEEITLRPRQPVFFVRASLAPVFGSIAIASIGPNPEIRLDDRITDVERGETTGPVIRNVSPGPHRLSIAHPDKQTWAADIDVRAGKIARIEPTYHPARGKVTVAGLPDTEIRVDGTIVGRIPPTGVMTLDGLPVGDRLIQAAKRKFLSVERTVQVRRGETTVELIQKPALAAGGVSEFFQAGKKEWDAPAGWQFKPGVLTVQGNGVGFIKNKEFADFGMSFLAEPANGRGIVWVLRADDEGRGQYLFQLVGPQGDMPGRFNTYIERNGVTTLVRSEPLAAALPRNAQVHVDVEAQGGTIRHFLSVSGSRTTHAPIGTFEDRSFVLGKIGFGTLNGEVFRVRFLAVKPAP